MKCLIIAALALAAPLPLVGQTGEITGRVTDHATGQPLPGANVTIVDTRLGAATNENGQFVIQHVPAGIYAIRIQMLGYAPALRTNVRINAGTSIELSVSLQPTTIEMPEVIISASKKAGSLMETPATVSVMDASYVRQQNILAIDEALQFAPGVNLLQGQINIRGSSGYTRGAGSRVMLLVDGIPMLPGDSGDIKWDAIPVGEIERIEIVKGAASALYGSSAIGGVINVITRDPGETPETELRATAGIYDKPYTKIWRWTDRTLYFEQQEISHSRAFGNLGLRLSAGRRNSTGYREAGQLKQYTFHTKAKYRFSPAAYVIGYITYAVNDNGSALLWQDFQHPFLADPAAVDNTIYSTKLQSGVLATKVHSSRVVSRTRFGLYRNTYEDRFVDNNDHAAATKTDLDSQLDINFGKSTSLTLGTTVTFNNVSSTIYNNHHTWDFALYAQQDWQPAAALTINAGLRSDYHWIDTGRSEYQITPKFGVVYAPQPSISLRLVSGRGFRSATVAELFTSTTASGFQVVPNIGLTAESSWSYEIGMQAILPFAFINIAAYLNKYRDLIEPDFVTQQGRPVIQFQNLNRARIRGFEAEVRTDLLHRHVALTGGYTYLDTKDETFGGALGYRPKHLVAFTGELRLPPFVAGADFRYVSRLQKVKIFPDDPRVSQKVTNIRAGFEFGLLAVTANVNNLFNYQYTQVERTIEPTRSFGLNLRVRR